MGYGCRPADLHHPEGLTSLERLGSQTPVRIGLRPIVHWGLRVVSEEELILPPVGLLPDVLDSSHVNLPPLGRAGIRVVRVMELPLRVQVVLGQCPAVGAELPLV